jgi:hypothetical protein
MVIQDAFQNAVAHILQVGSESLGILFQNLVVQQQQMFTVLQAGFTQFLTIALAALEAILPPFM